MVASTTLREHGPSVAVPKYANPGEKRYSPAAKPELEGSAALTEAKYSEGSPILAAPTTEPTPTVRRKPRRVGSQPLSKLAMAPPAFGLRVVCDGKRHDSPLPISSGAPDREILARGLLGSGIRAQ